MIPARPRLIVVAASFVAMFTGCTVLNPPRVGGQILQLAEPDTRRAYQLYVPAAYSSDKLWPVAVVCHAAGPFDSPRGQIDEWKGLAEGRQFLVVAPQLVGVGGSLSKDPARKLALLRQDEEAVLAILRHVRGARGVDTNRVFIVGWLGGAYPALYLGLKNPDVFRAISLRQPYFDGRFVEPCLPYLDYQQPIQVVYGVTDFHRDQATACIEWFRAHRMFVTDQESGGAHRRDPADSYAFMRRTVEGRPWLRVQIEGTDPTQPLAVRFTLHSSEPVVAYLWDLGDGQSSKVAAPEHVYASAGTYTVRVTARIGGKQFVRQLEVKVPPTLIGATGHPDK